MAEVYEEVLTSLRKFNQKSSTNTWNEVRCLGRVGMSHFDGGEKKKSSIIAFLRMIFLRQQTWLRTMYYNMLSLFSLGVVCSWVKTFPVYQLHV